MFVNFSNSTHEESDQYLYPINITLYINYKQHKYHLKDTHCFCLEKLEQGKLNKTCRLNTSSHFQSDVIGTSTFGTYLNQIAMYTIYYGTFNIEGTKICL